jgi:hypothetical protein
MCGLRMTIDASVVSDSQMKQLSSEEINSQRFKAVVEVIKRGETAMRTVVMMYGMSSERRAHDL